jgi:hypothetical protein
MAIVKIGGTDYEVPEMNFAALERAWPFVMEAMIVQDPMKGVSAGIKIIAAGLIEADHFDPKKFNIEPGEMLGDEQMFDRVVYFLKKKIKAKEIDGIRKAVDVINQEAGLEPAPGEAIEPLLEQVRQNLSQETAPTSSPSLSPPDTKEEAGA